MTATPSQDTRQTPDGAKAFGAACDLEEDFNAIRRLTDALAMIARGARDDETMQRALYGIADGIEHHLALAVGRREEIFHATAGFRREASNGRG